MDVEDPTFRCRINATTGVGHPTPIRHGCVGHQLINSNADNKIFIASSIIRHMGVGFPTRVVVVI